MKIAIRISTAAATEKERVRVGMICTTLAEIFESELDVYIYHDSATIEMANCNNVYAGNEQKECISKLWSVK